VACASAPWPGYCRLHVKSEGPSVCPAIAEVYAWDVICLAQTHLFHRTIPAWPVRGLVEGPSALLGAAARCASLVAPRAQAARAHPGAETEPRGGSWWPQELGSASSQDDAFPLPTIRRTGCTT
jgi:hypothetical protein